MQKSGIAPVSYTHLDVYKRQDPSNLPAIPAGMQYQLWGIVDGKPVDAGLIITTTADKKYRIQKMKSFGKSKVEAFAVTLETAGGNPTPKGDMYAVSYTHLDVYKRQVEES